jgi:hypothetical protein
MSTAAPAEKPVAEKPAKPAKIEQNGVVRPNTGTATGRVWEIADAMSKAAGAPAARGAVVDACVAESINPSTAATQYGKWCKFFGIKADDKPKRVPAEKPAKAPKEPKAPKAPKVAAAADATVVPAAE